VSGNPALALFLRNRYASQATRMRARTPTATPTPMPALLPELESPAPVAGAGGVVDEEDGVGVDLVAWEEADVLNDGALVGPW